MKYILSKESINTFVGDVFPLWIKEKNGADVSQVNVSFSTEGDGLLLRDFKQSGNFSVSHGILVTVMKAGRFSVIASVEGQTLTLIVDAHPMKRATSEEATNYYRGDMHTHTTMIHDPVKFASRAVDFHENYIAEIKKEALLDFGVISDHAETINDRDFFRSFVATEEGGAMRTTIFPGTESEIVYNETSRLGFSVRKSGEILTLNANGYILASSYKEFIDTFKDMPEPIVIFAHPQVYGWGEPPAMWDFAFPKFINEDMKRMVRGIEVIDGGGANLNYEQSYSYALDAGYRVSPYADGDIHEKWMQNRLPHCTVLMATENTKEALLDAVRSGRAYATESGTVKLRYTVNGSVAPADLAPANEYRFHIELDTFDGNDEALPVSLRVISDYGKTVLKMNCAGKKTIDFTVTSDTARYFYLRFMDKNAKRTISCPVYTGRAYDDFDALPTLRPIDMSACTATDAVSGKDASLAIDGNAFVPYVADEKTASIVIDMKENKKITALGHIPWHITRNEEMKGERLHEAAATIPAEYSIHTSTDGVRFTKLLDGYCRIFADEEMIRFAPTEARYVRFDVSSTVGAYSENPTYADATVTVGNLAIFEE